MASTITSPSAAPAPGRHISLWSVAAEFARHPDNALFIGLWLLCAAVVLATGPGWLDIAWFLFGWFVFLPQEWLTHVYVLHWRGVRGERAYRWMYRLHYGHHDLPKRHDLMYMPLWLTLPMTALNFVFFMLVAPDWHSGLAAFTGALAGYLLFEWSHLLCHVPCLPRSAYLREIRNRHLMHHCINEHLWFSVSPPAQWIDRVTGHLARREDAPRSPTTTTILADVPPHWREGARRRFAGGSSGDIEQSGLWLRRQYGTQAEHASPLCPPADAGRTAGRGALKLGVATPGAAATMLGNTDAR
jgi:hypothetical protein